MTQPQLRPPLGLLFDFGGTLVEEVAFVPRAGMTALLAHAAPSVSPDLLDAIAERVARVQAEVSDRRDQFQIEVSWAAVTRLVYDYFGIRFARPLDELEVIFWDASITTRPMAGARDALAAFHELALPLGTVSNTAFRDRVIRHELAKHYLADHITVGVASSEYSVRKPNRLLFETAAALLGIQPRDIWFIGDRLDTDVAGARAAGMTAVLYAPNDRTQNGADAVVATWDELLAIVRASSSRTRPR
jgi:putative hydrolase of the HAD superfamily